MECGKYDYRVQPGDVDLTQKASIITLGNHILHAAGEDADRLGFGLRWMQSNNKVFDQLKQCFKLSFGKC